MRNEYIILLCDEPHENFEANEKQIVWRFNGFMIELENLDKNRCLYSVVQFKDESAFKTLIVVTC